MAEFIGVDTILGLVGSPPMTIQLSRGDIELAEGLRQIWNRRHLAFLPYCFVCKVPLIWHFPPEEDRTLFHCPKCERNWIVSEGERE